MLSCVRECTKPVRLRIVNPLSSQSVRIIFSSKFRDLLSFVVLHPDRIHHLPPLPSPFATSLHTIDHRFAANQPSLRIILRRRREIPIYCSCSASLCHSTKAFLRYSRFFVHRAYSQVPKQSRAIIQCHSSVPIRGHSSQCLSQVIAVTIKLSRSFVPYTSILHHGHCS